MDKPYATLILTIAFSSGVLIAYSYEGNTENFFARPQVEYKSSSLRDPFKEDILKKGILEEEQPESNSQNPVLPPDVLPEMDVQGLIWGGNFPQAIINNKVYKAGDVIDGAQIKEIDKDGVTLNFSGGEVKIPAPKKQ